MNIVLASASPRRRELLRRLGISFTVVSSGDAESSVDVRGLRPAQAAVLAAQAKAHAVADRHRDSLVIGADTIVVLDGMILHKPTCDADAVNMLSMLSGRRHQVITGIVLCGVGKEVAARVETGVWFKELTEQLIIDYVLTAEPRDKAGSYGIQGAGGALVQKIDGSFSNVVGLPLAAAADLLEQFGVQVLGRDDAGHITDPGGFDNDPTDAQATTQS